MSDAASGVTAPGPGCPPAEAARILKPAPRAGASGSPPETPTVQRRNRLSRSKDFDTVYRRGRSASSRYLVLHWFPRNDDPEGEPRRSRRPSLRRLRSRESREAAAPRVVARALAHGSRRPDYVLAARPGSPSPPTPVGRTGSFPRSRTFSRRRAREVHRNRPRARVALDLRSPDASGNLQVPPELLAVRDRLVPRVRPRPRRGARELASAALQPVEPRRSRLRP